MGSPSDPARHLLDLARSRPPTLGDGRLVCIDGPAGSGKTTLAASLAALAGAPVVHMDDLYDGWDGLPRVTDQLDGLLLPLTEGAAGSYRRYDWVLQEYVEAVTVAPAPLLVLEGVGAGSLAHAARCTVLAWVEAPDALRLQRGLTRDGPQVEQHWRRWMRAEAEHFADQRTRDRADVIVDGTAAAPPRSPGRVT
ncbi:AAA family ATPase [Nocardioides sp. cx-169]|uniref:AAA family ATPase n=1 Tax=Nocardioides sp. cx-169 TaxID=2899080 RepID=UPI001E3E444A|nr:AAA family ATPase [Nocardioides sp. cx-169]MCD4535034.1 AAA family ATPase [Nocardioides sp. cx-169]